MPSTVAAEVRGGRDEDAMAICFELVVNFGENAEAARAAAPVDPRPLALQAGNHRIPLHRALMNRTGSYIELSVIPVGVGWGGGPGRHAPEGQANRR